jgi:LuxR family maltose regulon positive regulatory protein
MEEVFDHPLTIVEAPMGYGKTTAVKECLNRSAASVLWQRVYDNSPGSFWKGLSRLFAKFNEDCSQSLARLGLPDDSVLRQEALQIIEGIELPAQTVLVIDDYHLIQSPVVNRLIEFLTTNKISNLHLVLITRFIDLTSLEELKLKGYLHHIAKETFEFTPKEISAYFKLCGIHLSKLDADKLYSLTEGWISALYLLMLGFIAEGGFANLVDIYKLVEKSIYIPFPEEIKNFLLTLSIFTSFTREQAFHMWGKTNTGSLLSEITNKNAFIKYDHRMKTYQVHNIFSNFLNNIFAQQDPSYRRSIYLKAAQWYLKTADYLTAMNYFYFGGDFDALLDTFEKARSKNINSEHQELLIRYLEDCPKEIRSRHHLALLIYAIRLFTFNKKDLFQKTCAEVFENIQTDRKLEPKSQNQLLGEFELIISFTKYNDIKAMSVHHQKAAHLMSEPTAVIDANGIWTFGSPSILYLFYRESGRLEQHVSDMIAAMPYYYKLTHSHGNGAEYVMQAECYYYRGDFKNAEITIHKALYAAQAKRQTAITVCAVFLQMRLALVQGDFSRTQDLLQQLRAEILQRKEYIFIHTLDLCESYIYLVVNQPDQIPVWVAQGEFTSSRLFFQIIALYNVIYGKLLLVKQEYLKLIGICDQFNALASIFPNLLAKIYNYIHLAGANQRIFRPEAALEALREAFQIAMPDQVYLPFVENCLYIQPLLEKLSREGFYREDIAKILELYANYQKAVKKLIKEHFSTEKPKLTARELEIARLATEKITNKEIGARLFISENTVKMALKSIYAKLSINNRTLLKQYLDNLEQ